MAITENQIKFGPVVKVAGQSEEVGLDVLEELGKKRAYVSSVATAGSAIAGAVSVTTSEIALRVGGTNLSNRQGIEIQNLGTAAIYVGPTGVTTSTGIKLAPETSRWFAFRDSFTLFGIAAAGTQNVRVMEVS